MAGAVGMEVISPIPMAPQATFSPGFSTMMGVISGIWLARNNPSVPYLAVGRSPPRGYRSVRAKPMLITTPPSICPSTEGVHGLAHIVGRHHLRSVRPCPACRPGWHSRRRCG